jgi:hypothetical protein
MTATPYVALVTAVSIDEEDFDLPPLQAALTAAGISSQVLAWDDPAAGPRFTEAALCLLRSPWNYVHHHDAFLAWVDRVGAVTPLWNPAPVVRWNSHKGYLFELEAAGIPIVPTRLVSRGSAEGGLPELTDLLGGWSEAVIKPAISAGSFATLRVGTRNNLAAGEAHLAALVAERDMLIQRYEPAVESHGERALIWIAGAFTHAIRKSPRFAGDEERVSPMAMPIAPEERALGERILIEATKRLEQPLLYARVDLVRDPAGAPRLMELELIEPSLFFAQHPPAVDRLAAAIRRLLP